MDTNNLHFPSFISIEKPNSIDLLVNAVETFARTSSYAIYILDYYKKEFLFVSDNLGSLCDIPSYKIKDLGYLYFTNYVPEKELAMIASMKRKGFEFFQKIPLSERLKYTMYYDFHIIGGKKETLVNHRSTPISLTPDGKVWLELCCISYSANRQAGNMIIKKVGTSKTYKLSEEGYRWEEEEAKLSDLERDILVLSSQGYTMEEIADKTCKSTNTIKSCKRKLFEKLNANDIAQALSLALSYKLI